MRISDWSSDVCSSDLQAATVHKNLSRPHRRGDPLAGLRGNLQTGNCRLRKKSQKACIRMRRGTKFVGIIAVARRVMAKTAGDICAIELIVEEIEIGRAHV